jgi:hypothetical protein
MKNLFIIVLGSLFLVGCSDDSSQVSSLKSALQDTRFELDTCQSNLKDARSANSLNSGGFNQPPAEEQEQETQETQEPQYETVRAYHIQTKLGNTVCYKRNDSDDGEDIACGMTFSDCKDGYIYRCITDVKYKIVEEQKLVE